MGSKMTPEAQDLEAQKQDLAPDWPLKQRGLMAKRPDMFMDGPGRHPVSRDFGLADMPCVMNDCVANNGSGKCIVPSLLSIGADGKCSGYQPMIPDKKKGKK